MGRPRTSIDEKKRKKSARNRRYRAKLKAAQKGISTPPDSPITPDPTAEAPELSSLSNIGNPPAADPLPIHHHPRVQSEDEEAVTPQHATMKSITNHVQITGDLGDIAKALGKVAKDLNLDIAVTVTITSPPQSRSPVP